MLQPLIYMLYSGLNERRAACPSVFMSAENALSNKEKVNGHALVGSNIVFDAPGSHIG